MAYKQSPGRMNMPKTGRGLDAPTLMKGSPLNKFPILGTKMTKVQEGEKVIVGYNGKETVYPNLADAKSAYSELHQAWSDSTAGGAAKGSIDSRPTLTGVTDLGNDNFTEQRKKDVDAGGVSDRYAQAFSRSAKNPKGKDQRSAYLQQDNKPLSSTFSISADEKSGITSRTYKDSEEPKNK